jgi:hypothetical protein
MGPGAAPTSVAQIVTRVGWSAAHAVTDTAPPKGSLIVIRPSRRWTHGEQQRPTTAPAVVERRQVADSGQSLAVGEGRIQHDTSTAPGIRARRHPANTRSAASGAVARQPQDRRRPSVGIVGAVEELTDVLGCSHPAARPAAAGEFHRPPCSRTSPRWDSTVPVRRAHRATQPVPAWPWSPAVVDQPGEPIGGSDRR